MSWCLFQGVQNGFQRRFRLWSGVLLALLPQVAEAAEEAREDSLEKKAQGTISATLARANPLAATGQTMDVVRWMSKRRQFTLRGVPYGFTGMPVVYFSPSKGWIYGVRVHWVDYSQGYRPYRYKMTSYILKSTKGNFNFTYKIKVPYSPGTGFGLRLLLKVEKDIGARYYGLGNDLMINKAKKDENYYLYILKRPRFIVNLLREIRGSISASAGIGLEWTDVDKRGESAFYDDEGTPDGVKDGGTGFFTLTLEWDSRDDDTVARQGVFHEWSYENSSNSLIGLFFEKIDFRRYTFTDSRYYSLTKRLLLAHRMVFEALTGSVPLYAYGEIGGSQRIKGLGGSDSLRGFDKQRFTDNVRFFSNTEMRYQLCEMRLFKQYLEWYGVGFVDSGRVWPALAKVSPGGMHWTAGVGSRLIWNSDFVIRTDIGFSNERKYVALKYRKLF